MGIIVPDWVVSPFDITTSVYISLAKGTLRLENKSSCWMLNGFFTVYKSKEDRVQNINNLIDTVPISIEISTDQLSQINLFDTLYQHILTKFPNASSDI